MTRPTVTPMEARWPSIYDEPKSPKPVPPSKWVPIAEKHNMEVSYRSKCITYTGADDGLFLVEFWGDGFLEKDAGNVVLKVEKMIKNGGKSE